MEVTDADRDAWRSIVERLIEPDPWEQSQEGLDDWCHFCGSDRRWWQPPPGEPHWRRIYHHVHETDCAWVQAHEALDRPLPDHHYTVATKPEWLP